MLFLWIGLALVGGLGAGYFVRHQMSVNSLSKAERQAEKLLIEAKEKSFKLMEDAKKEEDRHREELSKQQQRLEKRETLFDHKLLELETSRQEVDTNKKKSEELKEQIKQLKQDALKKLEEISGYNREEARNLLLEKLEKEYGEILAQRIKKLQHVSNEELDKKAREILTIAVQRCAFSQVGEIMTTNVTLPDDEMKGRIIGREGRNIKAIEQLTGTEIIVDDTPNTIIVSAFSPVRRHVAKRALLKLISDGRIHPTKIEDAVETARNEIMEDIRKAGEEAVSQLGIVGFDEKLVALLGRLKYRSSYGQNVLQHSIEVAFLSALIAEQLGANVAVAKKGGLLHDIGKAVDHKVQGTHPEIGKDLGKKFGLTDDIIAPIAEHHDDHPSTLEAIIVKVADALSSSREGARNDTFEDYIQRLEELEKIALAMPGVEKAYAIQAGREIRVFVNPENIDDMAAHNLAKQIAEKIEEELKYPGEIKVTAIREMRVIEYAR
jgi:ribonuclease Y